VSDKLKEAAPPYRIVEAATPHAALAEELYRARVLRARQASVTDKILAGQRLFEAACEITLLGIQNQNPDATQERCREILRDRLVLRRRLEQAG
jgi:hypothetical protein